MERTLKARTELFDLIGEAYQVVGILADECGRFDDPHVTKMMDNLAAGQMVHADVLPFPSKPHKPTQIHGENIPTQSPVAPAALEIAPAPLRAALDGYGDARVWLAEQSAYDVWRAQLRFNAKPMRVQAAPIMDFLSAVAKRGDKTKPN
ncbi:MAG: hypothetical protein IPH37_14440 [Burkholderiales bacterium]|nr:hypothetical protein [Burkholderiales bacterium]